MAKLYFKYGAMGSSKTAQALITKFNYEERDMKVLFMKPSIDNRDGENVVKSRIGLSALAFVIRPDDNVFDIFNKAEEKYDVIIIDECQFLTEKQVDELADIVVYFNKPVLCFGLRTDFATHMFPGSKRLFEMADSIQEIKSICKCGNKATINARFDQNGKIIFEGEQICLGGNDRYIAMCTKCWLRLKHEEEQKNK
ncbi:thymidine kinase [Sedimentibacter sp. zth1]|uniref:thymidine kinase n=1 Tax=Sedimentibacter sp. zth1 TaxID=2816908 RepID=UPI001A91A07E|nr:thymidine kinase [Sedimentibacter sp. zth1]QSX06776.1 thymidine kinase [Sedimentibacter sp. zth1]